MTRNNRNIYVSIPIYIYVIKITIILRYRYICIYNTYVQCSAKTIYRLVKIE